MQANPKWKFAIGTTSRVPGLGGSIHYLIADFDHDALPSSPYLMNLLRHCQHIQFQRTPHGWHMFTDLLMSKEKTKEYLDQIGADPVWVKIGWERGYWFLSDKQQMYFTYPVERMILHYGEEEKT